MKEKLEELTVSQFLELICGNSRVLLGKNEVATPTKIVLAMRNIIIEYREIADMSGVKSYLSEIEELIKAKISAVVFTMCSNLIALKEFDRAREVLVEYGINADKMTDARVEAEIKSRLKRAENTVKRMEQEKKNDNEKSVDMRSAFYEQTAALMAYFKFQIDISTMKATVYAHLIARHNKEVKALKSKQEIL